MRDLATQPGSSAFQRWQQSLHIRPSKPGYKGGRVFQIGTEPDFADGDIRLSQFGIAEFPPQEDARQHMTDLLRDAQLPLSWAGGLRAFFRGGLSRFPPRLVPLR